VLSIFCLYSVYWGGARLKLLYGVACDETNLAILMRHRAVLFGLLGAFLCYAAFRRDFQPVAFIGAFVSVGSFISLARMEARVEGCNALVGRVVTIDLIALVLLVIGVVADRLQ
jgi:hypothetical protein